MLAFVAYAIRNVQTMIIKEADDKKPAIRELQALLSRPDCKADAKKRIEQEIRNIQAGARGEEEAAYEMKVHWGESKNWMAIHDLRIEHGGLVAQIDHLLINRFMEIWVCESKHFSEGIGINEHGEFAAFFGGKPYGVPSPIEQNAKHILILKKIFDSGAVKPSDRFDTTHPLEAGSKTIKDFHPSKRPLNVAEIFMESSNIGAALMAEKVGE